MENLDVTVLHRLRGWRAQKQRAMNASPQGSAEPSGPTCFSPATAR